MNSDDFEKRLQSQPMRRIPTEWREDILRTAKHAPHSSFVIRHPLLSTINHQLSTFLWPNPKAWAALAAVWIAIVAIQFTATDNVDRATKRSVPPSAEVLREQNQLLADLFRTTPTANVQHPKAISPQPRSERQAQTSTI